MERRSGGASLLERARGPQPASRVGQASCVICVCSRPTTSARTWSRWSIGWGKSSAKTTRARHRRQLADGTGEIADRLAAERPRPRAPPVAEGRARAGAHSDGFRRALELGADFVFEMDCDFSHDPADVPRLAAAAEDADLVIGSRYVQVAVRGTGACCDGRPARRLALRAALLAFPSATSPAGSSATGEPCWRRSTSTRSSQGLRFQIETTYRTIKAGLRIVEVPIVFTDREVGGSKMSKAIVLKPSERRRSGWRDG